MSKQKTKSYFGKSKQEKETVLSEDTQRPGGGESHQIASGDHPALTTNQGVALSDNQNSLRANPRGPTLLEDFVLREKITHFDHERIPERIVHARATGVHGFFELTA
jgi:catalase